MPLPPPRICGCELDKWSKRLTGGPSFAGLLCQLLCRVACWLACWLELDCGVAYLDPNEGRAPATPVGALVRSGLERTCHRSDGRRVLIGVIGGQFVGLSQGVGRERRQVDGVAGLVGDRRLLQDRGQCLVAPDVGDEG